MNHNNLDCTGRNNLRLIYDTKAAKPKILMNSSMIKFNSSSQAITQYKNKNWLFSKISGMS